MDGLECADRALYRPASIDIDAARGTEADVINAMRATDRRDHLFVRGGWPAASCEHVAVAAAVLEHRCLGSWILVAASRPGELNGHGRLKRRYESNACFPAQR